MEESLKVTGRKTSVMEKGTSDSQMEIFTSGLTSMESQMEKAFTLG